MTTSSTRAWQFLIEDRWSDSPQTRQALQVPPGQVSWVVAGRGSAVRLGAEPAEGSLAVEPLAGQEALAVVDPSGASLRINGEAVGPAAVLRLGDTLELAAGLWLHATIFNQPYLGPAREEHQGLVCGCCADEVVAGDDVLVCIHCQAALHLRAPRGDDVLECAVLSSTCTCCQRPLQRHPGYEYELD